MEPVNYYKTRLRARGQITLPPEVREHLGVGEGDDLVFYITEQGQIKVDRVRIIPPDQAWFWSERWQRMEREVQADIETGQMLRFDTAKEFLEYLDTPENADD